MLVLTRKVGEKVVVPGVDLTVTVLRVEGRRVRLGFVAPAAVQVRREEVACRAAAPPKKGDCSCRCVSCSPTPTRSP